MEPDIAKPDIEEPDIEEPGIAEPDHVPSPPAPPEETAADDEPEQEDAHEVVASEKDEPDTGVQTRRGQPSHPVISTFTGILNHCLYFTGKRKADTEADPKREKKKSREISEVPEESEPEPGKDAPIFLVHPTCTFPTEPLCSLFFFSLSASQEATRDNLRSSLPDIPKRHISPP